MADPRTVFLSTSGQIATLGRGADVAMSAEALDGIVRQGLKGWRCIMSGSMHACRAPTVTRLDKMNGADDADFDAAVAALLAGRSH